MVCFHVKSLVKMIKAFRVGHSLVLVGFPRVSQKLKALENKNEWEYSSLTVLVEL